nr:MAG TPA: hypothetical protein [Caudoviricetes sp.]
MRTFLFKICIDIDLLEIYCHLVIDDRSIFSPNSDIY